MTTQDQPRGSREAYERISDPAMYWTQTHGQPIREPIRESTPHSPAQPLAMSQDQPPGQASGERPTQWDNQWDGATADPDTRLAGILPYDDAEQPRQQEPQPYRARDYRSDDAPDAEERFGGVNWGAGFFGWLVAVSFAVLLAAGLGIVFTVLSQTVPAVPAMADDQPATATIALAVAALGVMLFAYYTGGYVAGRMSRFDGGRQGAGVWVTGLMLTALAMGVALFFGSEYDIFDRVDPPSLPVPADSLGLFGLVTAVVGLVGSLLAAIAGGKVGCRYHRKVDEYL